MNDTKVEISMNDLIVLRQVVDVASRGGLFKASDLTVVGQVWDKLNVIVEDFLEKNKEATEAEAPAEA